MDCCIADVVTLLGVVIFFCLRRVGEIYFMAFLMNSDVVEVVVDFWRLIYDFGNRRMLFSVNIFLDIETCLHQIFHTKSLLYLVKNKCDIFSFVVDVS